MTRKPSPAARLLTAATAVVLFRGGMVICTDLVGALERALLALGRDPPGELSDIAAAARDVVEARLDADVTLFDEGRDRLSRGLAVYWAGKALDPAMRG
jgi:hypothetical protein